MNTPKTVFTLKKVNRLNRLKSTGDTVRELYTQPIVNKTRKRIRKNPLWNSEQSFHGAVSLFLKRETINSRSRTYVRMYKI